MCIRDRLTIVRGTIPQAMFGRANYGAISGAMAGPSLAAKAAGPIVAAAILSGHAKPTVLLAILLAMSIISLGLYLHATRGRAHDNPASTPMQP